MSSKQLQSILKNIPSATAQGEANKEHINEENDKKDYSIAKETTFAKKEIEKIDRIVAEIPRSLKKQIKNYIEENPGMTEKTVILKALKQYGFNIDDNLILDKRTVR